MKPFPSHTQDHLVDPPIVMCADFYNHHDQTAALCLMIWSLDDTVRATF